MAGFSEWVIGAYVFYTWVKCDTVCVLCVCVVWILDNRTSVAFTRIINALLHCDIKHYYLLCFSTVFLSSPLLLMQAMKNTSDEASVASCSSLNWKPALKEWASLSGPIHNMFRTQMRYTFVFLNLHAQLYLKKKMFLVLHSVVDQIIFKKEYLDVHLSNYISICQYNGLYTNSPHALS